MDVDAPRMLLTHNSLVQDLHMLLALHLHMLRVLHLQLVLAFCLHNVIMAKENMKEEKMKEEKHKFNMMRWNVMTLTTHHWELKNHPVLVILTGKGDQLTSTLRGRIHLGGASGTLEVNIKVHIWKGPTLLYAFVFRQYGHNENNMYGPWIMY